MENEGDGQEPESWKRGHVVCLLSVCELPPRLDPAAACWFAVWCDGCNGAKFKVIKELKQQTQRQSWCIRPS